MPLRRISNKMFNLWENLSALWRGWPGFCAAFGTFICAFMPILTNPQWYREW